MLNRRILRVKVMQALYAFFQSPNTDAIKARKSLMLSIERVYELYLYYLTLPLSLAAVAEVQMEEAKNKVLPNEEDLNPNRKFVDSYVLEALKSNQALNLQIAKYKVSWTTETDFLRKLWKKLKQSDLYRDFLNNEDQAADHRKFFERFFKQFVLDNEDIYASFQEKSIYWDFEDSDYVLNMVIRYIGKIKAVDRYKMLPSIYKEPEEDFNFVQNLFTKTIAYNEELGKKIDEKTKNWDMDRIAVLDVVLMKMALIEFTEFSSIPVKVTMNEYIELSKFFSSPKSSLFINGVLDKILADLQSENKIKKTGRGLLQ